MIKLRAWHKEKKMMAQVEEISFTEEKVIVDKVEDWAWHFEDIELLQFSGYKDKTGKDIFEGDIIYIICPWGSQTWVVERNKNTNQLWLRDPYSPYDDTEEFSTFDLSSYTVGGNIYENQELIEKINDNK